jgi:hypothetical protein
MATVTLEVDDATLERAKLVAASANLPLEVYLGRLLAVSSGTAFDRESLPPVTRSALGMLKGLPDRPYKQLIEEAIIERHGVK